MARQCRSSCKTCFKFYQKHRLPPAPDFHLHRKLAPIIEAGGSAEKEGESEGEWREKVLERENEREGETTKTEREREGDAVGGREGERGERGREGGREGEGKEGRRKKRMLKGKESLIFRQSRLQNTENFQR